MKESIKMEELGGFKSTPIHKTNNLLLRWFANNISNPVSHHFLSLGLGIYFRDEDGIAPMTPALKRRMNFYIKIEKITGIPYRKWGTTYLLNMDEFKKIWEEDPDHQELMKRLTDYNENGVAYWEES